MNQITHENPLKVYFFGNAFQNLAMQRESRQKTHNLSPTFTDESSFSRVIFDFAHLKCQNNKKHNPHNLFNLSLATALLRGGLFFLANVIRRRVVETWIFLEKVSWIILVLLVAVALVVVVLEGHQIT